MRQPTHTLSLVGVRFDMQAKEVIAGGHTLSLTKGEYSICEHLALHAGQVFTKEKLYEAVFGFDAEGDSSAIAQHRWTQRTWTLVCSGSRKNSCRADGIV